VAKRLVLVSAKREGKRKCGSCTGCCRAPSLEAPPAKPFLKVCPELATGKKRGCGIYDTRPQGCRDYSCHWLQNGFLERKHRPDKIGVIFDDGVSRAQWLTRIQESNNLEFPPVTAREIWPGAFKQNWKLLKSISSRYVVILVVTPTDRSLSVHVLAPTEELAAGVSASLMSGSDDISLATRAVPSA